MFKNKVSANEVRKPAARMVEAEVDAVEEEIGSRIRIALKRKSWQELSPVQKSFNIVLAIVELILTAWALLDIKNRPQEQVNGKKITWVLTSFIQPVGPIIYFIFGRKKAEQTQPLTA